MSVLPAALGPDLAKRVVVYEDRDAWAEARLVDHRIGGSDVGAIQGVSPFSGPWDVFLQRHGQVVTEQTDDMARGHALEPAILALYARTYEIEVVTLPPCHIVHPEHPWAVASLDGLAIDSGAAVGELGVVDGKSHYDFGQPKDDADLEAYNSGSVEDLPPHEALQGYWYLEVTGLPWIDFAVLLPGRDWYEIEAAGAKYVLPWVRMRRVRLHAKPALQAHLLRTVGAWRQRHLIDGEQPPIDATRGCRLGVKSDHREGWAVADGDQVDLIYAAKAARDARKAAKDAEYLAKNRLLAAMGPLEALEIEEGGPRVKRTSRDALLFQKFPKEDT